MESNAYKWYNSLQLYSGHCFQLSNSALWTTNSVWFFLWTFQFSYHMLINVQSCIPLWIYMKSKSSVSWTTYSHARFEAFMAVKIQIENFWVVTPCSVATWYKCFGGSHCLCLHHPTTTLHGITTQQDLDLNLQPIQSFMSDKYSNIQWYYDHDPTFWLAMVGFPFTQCKTYLGQQTILWQIKWKWTDI